jgi:Mannosyl-glycoprotein endo-beta-N-acetylglucosaminidase
VFVAPVALADGVDTLAMTHLPAWVQVAAPTARMYVADNSDALAAPRPSTNTFLRVLGGGSSRLHVEAYDENGDPGLRGWVDPSDVLPSAPGTDWLVSSTATTLWRSTEPGANAVRSLDPFTPLQQIDGPVQDRIEVQLFATDFSGALDRGWVDAADTGPALPPHTAVPPPANPVSGSHSPSSTNVQQTFLDTTAKAARTGAAQTGVPASVTVAQAILESDWGRSLLALDANNYFGIKAIGRLGTDGLVWMSTGEFDASGQAYETVSPFRAYKSLTDSVVDHDRVLRTGSRYAAAMRSSNDPRQFAQQLSEAGYSTDPDYADKLVALMDRYDLYRLDA